MDLLFMNVDLLAISSELGYIEDGVYTADQNCKENLDSILDMVQNDDQSGSYRQQVGSAGIFTSDLIPLLGQKIDDEDLFDSLIRLLTSMTDPIRLNNTGEITRIAQYNRKVIEGFLLEYKKAFHNAALWVKLREKITKFLKKESTKNAPDLTGLALNFVRNLVTIDDQEESQVTVVCYADSGMARLIQYIASSADLDEWHLHATEIFSGLLKDSSPKEICVVDPQKDALKHCSFARPCFIMDECHVEYTPSMEDRMLAAKNHKHYEHIFLHYYFTSISNYCAQNIVESLATKVDSIECKYKIAVAQMCVWLINFVALFDSNRPDLDDQQRAKLNDKITKMFTLGLKLSMEFIDVSPSGVMDSFIRRSLDLLTIFGEINTSSKLAPPDEEFTDMTSAFIGDKMKHFLAVDNMMLNQYIFEFIDTMFNFLSTESCEMLRQSLKDCDVIRCVCDYISNSNTEKMSASHCETLLSIIRICSDSVDQICKPSILRLIFASTTKVCSSELNEFQISIFQHIKSMAKDEKELVQVCQRIVDDDPKLMAELALLFQFTLESSPKKRRIGDNGNHIQAEVERLSGHFANPDQYMTQLADRLYKQYNKETGTIKEDIVVNETNDLEDVLHLFGFELRPDGWFRSAGPLDPVLLKCLNQARSLSADAVSLVISRNIGQEQSKKKKRRGIAKNKKLGDKNRQVVQEQPRTQMEIF